MSTSSTINSGTDPQPVLPWTGIKKAKRNIRCVEFQFLIPIQAFRYASGQEDCLAVSVYTHSTDIATNNPVMVHFHGGNFEARFPPVLWWNPGNFMDYDVVVVVVSYRLSMFGFLSFENDVVPGNMGLKDQHLALRWIQNNIKYFGGDSSQVTLFGESAGASSAHFQAISPKSQGLLSKLILISGSAFAPWAFDPPGEARKKAVQLAEYAGCAVTSSAEMASCLREVDARTLATFTEQFRKTWDRDPIVLFKPTAEKEAPSAFITGPPSTWGPITVPVLGGLADEDGLVRSANLLLDDYDFDYVSANLSQLLPTSLFYDNPYTSQIPSVTRSIIDRYFGSKRTFTRSDELLFSELYSDSFFRIPMARAVQNTLNDVYLYLNKFVSENLYLIKGRVAHVQELFFLWTPDFKFTALTGVDLKFSEDMVKFVINFVYHGNPNDQNAPIWKTTSKSPSNLSFLSLENTAFTMVDGLYADSIAFWYSNGYRDLVN